MASEKKKPERIFRIGDVSASIFVQTVEGANEDRSFRTISLQKSYLSEGHREYTSSLSLAELPAAIEVLRMALSYVGDEKEEAVVV